MVKNIEQKVQRQQNHTKFIVMKIIICVIMFMCMCKLTISQIDTAKYTRECILDIFNITEIKIYHKKSSIPKSLKESLNDKFSSKIRLVEKRKGLPSPPDMQMLFLIENNNYYALILKRGGRRPITYFVFAKIISNKIQVVNLYELNNKVEDIDDFLQTLKYEQFEFLR